MEEDKIVYRGEGDGHSDVDDDQAFKNLKKALNEASGKKRVGEPRSEAATRVSEFEPISEDKVRLSGLCQGLPQNAQTTKLKKRLNVIEKKQKSVEVPLHKHEREQIQRVLAYEGAVKDISLWDPVVKGNQKASQMQFPLNQPHISMKQTTSQFVSTHQPRTEMELKIDALLKENRAEIPKPHQLSASEQLALKAHSIEEVQKRIAVLQKHNAQMSYRAAKMKRQGKIKSKKYHRIQRKVREKKEVAMLENLSKSNPELYQQAKRREELVRIKERMTLKHKGTSRAMKKQATFGKYDAQGRQAVKDMLELGQELRAKTTNFESESDAEDSPDHKSVDEDLPAVEDLSADEDLSANKDLPVDEDLSEEEDLPPGAPVNLWTSGKAAKKLSVRMKDSESTKQQNEVVTAITQVDSTAGANSSEDEQDNYDMDRVLDIAVEEEASRSVRKTNTRKQTISSDKEKNDTIKLTESSKKRLRPTASDHSKVERRHKNKRLRKETYGKKIKTESSSDEDSSGSDDDDEESDDDVNEGCETISGNQNISSAHPPSPSRGARSELISQTKFGSTDLRMKQTLRPDSGEGGDEIDVLREDGEGEEERLTLTMEAFTNDKVAREFKEEKKAIAERDRPKDIDMTLPGWGDWTGPGIKASKSKRKRYVLRAPPGPPRKDVNLPDVIISERKDESIAKHQVNALPYPFKRVQDFQDSIKKSIGSTFNKVATFKKNIKPKVITRMGAIITPISKSETFQKQIQGGHLNQRHHNPAAILKKLEHGKIPKSGGED